MDSSTLLIFLKGLIFGFGLIIAIGAQNAFVLKQGLKKNHVFVTAFVSSMGDTILILLGIGGLGSIIANNQILYALSVWGGGLFIFIFGLRSFLTVNAKVDENKEIDSKLPNSMKKTVFAALAFSFLNPHVYIDAVVLIGSLGAQYPIRERWIFAMGAVVSSWIWFYTLAYGAVIISPFFEKPIANKILNIVIGIIMWLIAYSLMKQPIIELVQKILS